MRKYGNAEEMRNVIKKRQKYIVEQKKYLSLRQSVVYRIPKGKYI